jgi:hypothetical protein
MTGERRVAAVGLVKRTTFRTSVQDELQTPPLSQSFPKPLRTANPSIFSIRSATVPIGDINNIGAQREDNLPCSSAV